MENLIELAKKLTLLKLSQKLPEYKRFLYEKVKNNTSKLVGIYGPRGVGKTTILVQLLKELNLSPSKAIFISCDHPAFSNISLFDFLEEFYRLGGKYVFIDEIHKLKDFDKHLKAAYDFLDLKIYFSGSSAIYLNNPDFLRRFSMFKLPILSLREFIKLYLNLDFLSFSLEEVLEKHEEIAFEIIRSLKEHRILEIFEIYKKYGAYPFFFEDKEKYLDRLTNVIDAAIFSDIAFLYSVPADKLNLLKKLLMTICTSKPFELSIESLSSLIGVSKVSLYKYIEYLSRADLIIHIEHEAKRFRNVRKPDKLYLANTNLLYALCLDIDKGTERETFFVSMLNYKHKINYVDKGDFLIDEKWTFEIGGKRKDFSQIKNIKNSYLAIDDIEMGHKNKIPLWLFGFLY